MVRYAAICGWVLARAHAKAGDAAMISGYLGRSDVFGRALAQFAHAYADQTEQDYHSLVEAARSGRVEAVLDQ
jgi:thiamine monophosphate kinase